MTQIALTARVVADPEMRFTPSGVAACNFRIADNHRKRNQAGQWEDDGASFYTVTCWRTLAESVVESVRKGDLVVLVGSVKQRDYETRAGEKRTAFEIVADDVGLSLKAPAKSADSAPVADPWANAG